ncbi:RHS repeat-associated core domain-containing protein [Pseudomonas syringae]|uniref:RHS repeat-associated core domain-containing protein n=1 Tax=Pseudomonas syringae TaxID=317 RepID=A0A6B2B0X1_PSESX|nr:RHS repeat-associated core domain-containing protein [Pseudomonas syringae]MBI6562274.1 RHS repeat-associated core domain-containing protein [Pseudomonas syringae]MBI6573569.1 RHS repeat-associated core domain-containing protein [Pseudomonas syringae]MBI6587279.1 RHS repeat-associated core domain-containing protein [Pseudomonas syringae]MBI6596437.1 RHS repeat-associated core domain-containing protein [Pseudomonas syringae]MDC6491617.1 RHS repeat-associated core domain-containing protein [P
MASSGQSVLCVYRYDPLDRLADCAPAGQGSTRLFYQKTHLATQVQGQVQHTLMRTDEHVLACLSTENNQRDGTVLATDQQQSVIAAQGLEFAYTPYGHRHPSGLASLPGFTGQRVDPVTGHYLLGNGYRAFNPVLMRFNSPDSLSPFGEGGVNAYGYCGGDPVNRVDPSGHWPTVLVKFLKRASSVKKRLLGRRGSQDSMSSPLVTSAESSGSTQVTASTNSVSVHVSDPGVTTKSPASTPPPIPPKKGQLNDVTPPVPRRYKYVDARGNKTDIHGASSLLSKQVRDNRSVAQRDGRVPYVMDNDQKYYEKVVGKHRDGNKSS